MTHFPIRSIARAAAPTLLLTLAFQISPASAVMRDVPPPEGDSACVQAVLQANQGIDEAKQAGLVQSTCGAQPVTVAANTRKDCYDELTTEDRKAIAAVNEKVATIEYLNTAAHYQEYKSRLDQIIAANVDKLSSRARIAIIADSNQRKMQQLAFELQSNARFRDSYNKFSASLEKFLAHQKSWHAGLSSDDYGLKAAGDALIKNVRESSDYLGDDYSRAIQMTIYSAMGSAWQTAHDADLKTAATFGILASGAKVVAAGATTAELFMAAALTGGATGAAATAAFGATNSAIAGLVASSATAATAGAAGGAGFMMALGLGKMGLKSVHGNNENSGFFCHMASEMDKGGKELVTQAITGAKWGAAMAGGAGLLAPLGTVATVANVASAGVFTVMGAKGAITEGERAYDLYQQRQAALASGDTQKAKELGDQLWDATVDSAVDGVGTVAGAKGIVEGGAFLRENTHGGETPEAPSAEAEGAAPEAKAQSLASKAWAGATKTWVDLKSDFSSIPEKYTEYFNNMQAAAAVRNTYGTRLNVDTASAPDVNDAAVPAVDSKAPTQPVGLREKIADVMSDLKDAIADRAKALKDAGLAKLASAKDAMLDTASTASDKLGVTDKVSAINEKFGISDKLAKARAAANKIDARQFNLDPAKVSAEIERLSARNDAIETQLTAKAKGKTKLSKADRVKLGKELAMNNVALKMLSGARAFIMPGAPTLANQDKDKQTSKEVIVPTRFTQRTYDAAMKKFVATREEGGFGELPKGMRRPTLQQLEEIMNDPELPALREVREQGQLTDPEMAEVAAHVYVARAKAKAGIKEKLEISEPAASRDPASLDQEADHEADQAMNEKVKKAEKECGLK